MLNVEVEERLLYRLDKALPRKDIHIDVHRGGFLQMKRRMKETPAEERLGVKGMILSGQCG